MSGSQLDFENQMFVELLSEDGLTILAKGLGLDRLFLKFLKLYSDPHNLVLVLNTSTSHEEYFINELIIQGVEHIPKSVTNEISAKERESLYLKGGIVFVTSRILVVDMLKKVCPIDKVSGLMLYNAHRVIDTSTEAFILRLYREDNKSGFIKGFSDSPEQFTSGFCQLERIMKNLFIKQVYLWPRFHAVVNASLQRHKPDVVELRQQMTPNMTAIQLAILDVMKACIKELKDINPSVDTEDVTVENCVGKAFDQIIKLQLDPVWNQLSYKTKQLIHDLKMLRTLLYFLTQYDCVTFYSYLISLRSTRRGSQAFAEQSPWIFLEAANTLFVKAQERVYGHDENRKTNNSTFLEESPKWHLLSMVLEEIEKEREENKTIKNETDDEEDTFLKFGSSGVLIVANDERTCYQLRQYLCEGGKKLLQKQFDRLLAHKQKVDITALPNEMQQQLQPKMKRGQSRKLRGNTGAPGLEPASKRRKKSEDFNEEIDQKIETDKEKEEDIFQNFELPEPILTVQPSGDDEGPGDFRLLQDPLVLLHALNSSNDPYHLTKVLRDNSPRFVVMYDADIKMVRQLEIYKATRPGFPLRVYFLVYDSSVEEQKYLTILRKEKESFQQLIHQRAHMVVPEDREGRDNDNSLLKRGDPKLLETTSMSTRKAGGQQETSKKSTVIVDMREFRSSLPSLLHKRGINIAPVTLEVGDYVLTPDICVERKSLNDLIGSLNSGRLFNQATAMSRYYKKPILMIEFEEGKPFSLQSAGVIAGDVTSQSVASKLVLLTMHFPKLRILWCPTPHFAAELFEELKAGQPQPDVEAAALVGTEGIVKEFAEGQRSYNPIVQDFLIKLPGINSKNCRLLMDKVKDMQELVSLSEKELENILGNDVNAGLLWNCLHTQPTAPSSTNSSSSSKNRKGKDRDTTRTGKLSTN